MVKTQGRKTTLHGVTVAAPFVRDGHAERIRYAARTFEFADLGVVPRAVIESARNTSELALVWAVLSWGLPPKQLAYLDDIPMTAVRARLKEWEEASSITIEQILGLMNATTKYALEIESDLIRLGLRLRNFPSPECTWRDLYVILRTAQPDSRFYQAANPEGAQWNLTNHLLAEAVDTLRWLQWAKTVNAQDSSTMPKPIPRPGVAANDRNGNGDLKGRRMPLDEAREVFDRPDPNRPKKLYELFR